MAAAYHLGIWRRLLNRLVRGLLRMGLGPPRTYLLTVRGRTSGRLYSTPVTVIESGARRWLVAPYGEVAWVRNARSARQVRLSRSRHSEVVSITEVQPDEAGPVLKRYATEVPITRPFGIALPAGHLAVLAMRLPPRDLRRVPFELRPRDPVSGAGLVSQSLPHADTR